MAESTVGRDADDNAQAAMADLPRVSHDDLWLGRRHHLADACALRQYRSV